MKLRHQKKQIKKMMADNSAIRNSSTRQLRGAVSRFSKKGRVFLMKQYHKKAGKDGLSEVQDHVENISQEASAANMRDYIHTKKNKRK